MSFTTRNHKLLTLLIERFPEVFAEAPEEIRPLKVGIRADIEAVLPDVSPSELRKFMAGYCGRTRYLSALAAGRPRVDLDGQPVGEVSEVLREQARREILARQEAATVKVQAHAERIARYRELEAEAHRQALIRKEAKKAKMATKQRQKAERKAPAPVVAKPAAKAPVVVVKKKRRVVP